MAKRKCNELVALPKDAPKDPLKVPFETIIAWVFRSGTKFDMDDNDALRIQIGQGAPQWLWETLYAHHEALHHLAKCRRLDAHIDGRLRKLKEGVDAELHRRGIIYLTKKCDEMEALCKSPIGYNDPANLFAWECLEGYRETLAKLGT
jgi:hypothetical protein